MPQTIIHRALTVAAGTAFDAPDEQALTFLPATVARIVVHIRKGHGGLTGIMLYYGAQQVVPSSQTTEYLKGDGRTYDFDVSLFVQSGSWLALLANVDIYPHTFDIDFELDDLTDSGDELPLVFVPLAFESQGVSVAN